jgi:tetratricopeptide (TPR) repeat protein
MDPRVERFIKYGTWYTQKFSNSDKDAEIRFRIGRLYYLTNHFGPAEKFFKEVTLKHKNTKYSEYSANLLLDIYNLKKDYAGLEKMGNELLADDSFAKTKAGSDIRNVLEKANFKKAQDLEVAKSYNESAVQFQLFALQNPKSELAVMALFNAGVNFERAGRNYDAVQNYIKVIASNDKSAAALKAKAQKLLAKVYQDSGQFEESAALFKQLAKDNPKEALASNYLFNAAVMYEALGKTSDSVNAYLEYVQVNKNTTENANTMFNIAQMQRKANLKQPAILRYKEYLEMPHATNDKKLEANYWIYELGRSTGRHKDPEEAQQNVLGLQRKVTADKKSKANAFVGKIKFNLAKETFAKLKTISIPADPAKQKKAVDKKLEVMNQLNQELSEVIKLDSAEEIVGSLDLLGEANKHMAEAIENTPLPPQLKEEQKKMYRTEIEKISGPFNKKAEESYKLAVERAWDLEVYTDSYRNSFEKMNRLNPKAYYSRGESRFDTRLINWGDQK